MSQVRDCSNVHRLGGTMCTAVVVFRIVILITSVSLLVVAEEFPGSLQLGISSSMIRGSPQHGPMRLLLVLWANRHNSTAPEPDGRRGLLVVVVSIVIIIINIIVVRLWSAVGPGASSSAAAAWFRVGQPGERGYRRGLTGVTCCTATRDSGGLLLLLLVARCVVRPFALEGGHWDIR